MFSYLRHVALFIVVLAATSAGPIRAQTTDLVYQRVTFLQVAPDHIPRFLDAVEQLPDQASVHWRLYQVPFSSNTVHRYNYVLLEISAGFENLQSESRPTMGTLRRNRQPLDWAIHTEIWRTRATVYGTEMEYPSRYVNANFMRVIGGRTAEYVQLEVDLARPLHQDQVDNARMNGWNFYQLVFPTGRQVLYQFVTTDYYSSIEQNEHNITREIIQRVHPDMDVDEFDAFAEGIRERVFSDLWELVDYRGSGR
jgi:hypothetical protein